MFRTLTTLFLFFFGLSAISAQEISTFNMEYEGEAVEATRDVPSLYFGNYVKTKDADGWMFSLQYEMDKSYQLTAERTDPLAEEYTWHLEDREAINWGVLVRNGQIAQSYVYKLEQGKTKKYEAMVFLYQNIETGEYDYKTLYEKEGQFYLDDAEKHRDMSIEAGL